MADSFNKKDREKRRRKKKQDKAELKKQRKLDGVKGEEFMYVDENGNLSPTPPDPAKKKKINAEDIVIGIPQKTDDDSNQFERTGFVKFFNSEKGYGFIVDQETQESFFVHANNLIDEIQDNDKVIFEVGSGPKGPVANAVKLVQ